MSFGKRERERSGWIEQETSASDVTPRVSRNAGNDEVSPVMKGLGAVVMLVALVYGAKMLLADLLVGNIMRGPEKIEHSEAYAKVADLCSPSLDAEANNMTSRLNSDLMGVRHRVRKASYLNCLMVRHPERFCESGERAAMARDLKAYFSYHHEQRAHAENARRLRREIAQKHNMDWQNDGLYRGTEVKEIDMNVVSNFKDLVCKGYLSASDFGWSLPEYMKPLFENVERAGEPC